MTGSPHVSYLAVVVLPILFQFRLYHDAILSFSGVLQVSLSLIFCALIFLYKYLEDRNTTYLVLSLVSYNISLYSYEVCILLLPLFLIIICARNHAGARNTIKSFMPYALSVIVALMAIFLARQLKDAAAARYAGIAFSLGPRRVVRTFFLQLYAALPLSYYTGNPSNLFHHTLPSFLAGIRWSDALVLVLGLALYLASAAKLRDAQRIAYLFYLGAALMVIPAMPIAFSLKYQESLRSYGAGMGYVPVYLQYYGTALLMAGVVVLVLRHLSGKNMRILAHLAVIGALSTALLINLQNNRLVVDKANVDLHYRRAALARALGENILQDVPEQAKLYVLDEYVLDPYPSVRSDLKGWANYGYPWRSDAFVYLYARKRVQVIDDRNGLRDHVQNRKAVGGSGATDLYCLSVKSYADKLGIREGYVVLSRVDEIYTDGTGNIQLQSTPLRFNVPPAAPSVRDGGSPESHPQGPVGC
jgi:hypothetical protein